MWFELQQSRRAVVMDALVRKISHLEVFQAVHLIIHYRLYACLSLSVCVCMCVQLLL